MPQLKTKARGHRAFVTVARQRYIMPRVFGSQIETSGT